MYYSKKLLNIFKPHAISADRQREIVFKKYSKKDIAIPFKTIVKRRCKQSLHYAYLLLTNNKEIFIAMLL